jgi:peptidoglycan biosynthesis protein MviN/MurJ (putative lipid II flippase)
MGPFGYLGLAAATTISGITNMSMLLIALKRRFDRLGIKNMISFLLNLFIINILLAIGVAAICALMNLNTENVDSIFRGIMLLILLSGYIIVYVAVCRLMSIEEVKKLLSVIRRG